MSSREQEELFEHAAEQLTRRIGRECRYRPTEYLKVTKRYGALQGAKFLLSSTEPISYDSLRVASDGRRDLTIEALVCSQEWPDLFTAEERELAKRRYGLLAPPTQPQNEISQSTDASEPTERLDDGTILIGNLVIPTDLNTGESQPFEDDIAWGEELVEGVQICDKLAAMEAELAVGGLSWSLAGWVVPVVRNHLEICGQCAEKCTHVRRAIDELEERSLDALGTLLCECEMALNCTAARAQQLLSREWKAAGFEYLPSEFEKLSLDWNQFKWKDPSRPEWLQHSHWIDVLSRRAVQFCRHVGGLMLRYEDTQEFSPISKTQAVGDASRWIDWRTGTGSERIRFFVKGLSRSQFSTALVARGVAAVLRQLPTREQLVLPGGDDLSGVEGSVEIKDATEPGDWETILGRWPGNVDGRALLEMACSAADNLVGQSDLLPDRAHGPTLHSNAIGSSAVTADDLGQLGRGLAGLLDWLEGVCNCKTEDLKKRVDRLTRCGRLPREIANSMHTVREYRNMSEHEHFVPDQRQSNIVRLAWEDIANWAVSQGWSPPNARW